MVIRLVQDSTTGALSFPQGDSLDLGRIIETHGSIAALTADALKDKFPDSNLAQPGDYLFVGDRRHVMVQGATDAQLVASWEEDVGGSAGRPTIQAAVDADVTVTSEDSPSFILLNGATKAGGEDWVTTWDLSNTPNAVNHIVKAFVRDQLVTIVGATKIIDGLADATSPLTIPFGQTAILTQTFIPSVIPTVVVVATVAKYTDLYTQTRDDGTAFQEGDIADTTEQDGGFAPGRYVRDSTGVWGAFTPGGGTPEERIVNVIRIGASAAPSGNTSAITVTSAAAPDTSNLVWKIWIQKAADNSFIEAFLRVSDTEYMSVGRIA